MRIDPIYLALLAFFIICSAPALELLLLLNAMMAAYVIYGVIWTIRQGRREMAEDFEAIHGRPDKRIK